MSYMEQQISDQIDGGLMERDELYAKIAKLEQSLAEAKEREGQFWHYLPYIFEIESKEELEEIAKGWEPKNSLLVALHYLWKRDPIVVEKDKQLEAMREWGKEASEFISLDKAKENFNYSEATNLSTRFNELLQKKGKGVKI